MVNSASNTIGVLLGNGAGSFATATTFSSGGTAPQSLAVGDFDGDGKLDIAVANYSSSTVGILLGNGSGGFAAATTFNTGGSGPDSVVAADFNGDGKLDLATANYASGSLSLLLGNGSGGFAAATTFSTAGAYPYSVITADFNGDGKLDLAAANYNNSNVSVLLGNGSGNFATATTFSTGGSYPDSVVAADFNGDGKLDLAAANYSNNTVGVLLGDGTGSFTTSTTYGFAGSGPSGLAVGDFNGDGKPDLATANISSSTLSVLINTTSPVVRSIASASGTTYQVQTGGLGAGQIAATSSGALTAMDRLRVAGADYTPPLATAGLANSGSTVVTPTVRMSNLNVYRRVTVATAGSQDFVRTVETFQNPTASSITAAVTILGNLGSDAATTVFATSDGTGTVNPSCQWFGTDDADGIGTPAVIHYIHGPQGMQPSSVSVSGDNVSWTYNLTVPAGQTVELAWFTISAATRSAAIAAAGVLVTNTGLGGHAADYLSSGDLAALANFYTTTSAVFTTTPVTGTYGSSINLAARLTSGGVPLAGETLHFLFNGASVGTASTDATGTASVSLSGVHVGTYTGGLSVSFAGDGYYLASSGTANLTVSAAPLTITANNQVMIQGAALPSLPAGYSGFVNGDTAASLTTRPTLSTTATSQSPAGTYPITASGAVDTDYSITYVAGTLTVTTLATAQPLVVQSGMTQRSYVDRLSVQFNKPLAGASIPATLSSFGTDGSLHQSITLTADQFAWSGGGTLVTWSLDSFAGCASSLPRRLLRTADCQRAARRCLWFPPRWR